MQHVAGQRLRDYLARRMGNSRGWQAELARQSGVHPTMLSRWWTGERTPDLDSLERVARAVGVRRYELVAEMDGAGPVGPLDPAALDRLLEEAVRDAVSRRLGQAPDPEQGR